jgi:predicted peroxiredoxin
MANNLLIMLTTGPEDRGSRATLAFAMGVSSLISGVDTALFMTMAGTFWSREASLAKVHIEGFEPLGVYVDQYREAGGRILVCSPCNDFYCAIGKESPLMPGSELSGLTAIVDIALGASVVTL